MNGEEESRHPRSGHIQSPQDTPEQNGADTVEENVNKVISDGIQSPQTPFHPKHAGGQGEVIRGVGGEPEPVKSIGSFDERIVCQE